MSTRELRRFETEKEARDYAKRESHKHGDVRYVVESRHPANEVNPGDGRFVVDTDGFTRSWERSIATYENGRLDQ